MLVPGVQGVAAHSMDVSFNNVLEVSRQYFMGVPKPAEGSGQNVWPAPLPEEGAPAQSGAPAPSSRPPSAAAAPPGPPSTPVTAPPPRPPSEPIEPEPHIIHKATVMREAAEKRRELPEVEDEEEPPGALSPPSHIIRKPARTLPSPAPAPAAPCPSPARPPSSTVSLPPPSVPDPQLESPVQYRPPLHPVQTPSTRPPDPFAPSRPPDPYSASRPPEQYPRFHYESTIPDSGRNLHGPVASPQPSVSARHSPHSYARMTSSISQHAASRLRDIALHSPPSHGQRYSMPPTQPPPPHNDRVPPIYHPQTAPSSTHPSSQRASSAEVRSPQIYPPLQARREASPYARVTSNYDRQPAVPSRKYDPQQAYPGYRPAPSAPQILPNHRMDTQQHQYKHVAMDTMSAPYSASRSVDRSTSTLVPSPHDPVRLPSRADYPVSRSVSDARSGYHYPTPSTSSSRYSASVPASPTPNSSLPLRTAYTSRQATAPKTGYDYATPISVQTSPARSSSKSGYPNQQTRMTVSVTSLVHEMNKSKQKRASSPMPATSQVIQTKQKRESPLDLSVKTVKNSADSSTTQDDAVDSASSDHKPLPLPPRPPLISSRSTHMPGTGYAAAHKVDFAPNFNQYGERSASHSYSQAVAPGHPPVRYNGSFETRRVVPEQYPAESPHHTYPEQNKYSVPVPVARPEFVPKIDLTRSVNDQRHIDSRIRDDRNFVIEERKRTAGSIVSNIPEKILRYDASVPDSRMDRMNQSAREQHELMIRPVYSYNSHKQFEAYQNEEKKRASHVYREHHMHGSSHRYPSSAYPGELPSRESILSNYHNRYHDKNPPISNTHPPHIIPKHPNHREVHPHHLDLQSRIPAKQSVLSILRNSLETKQTACTEPVRNVKPDIIVIDDADDPVIEITDLPKEKEPVVRPQSVIKPFQSQTVTDVIHNIQMPKAVDSILLDTDYQTGHNNIENKPKSPENDVASRIRTKAELKVMPPSEDHSLKTSESRSINPQKNDKAKLLPKSQKQHLFNQIREDLRLESVIKCELPNESPMIEVKTEPINIEDIERDAELSIKTEIVTDSVETTSLEREVSKDLDWDNACDSFMEQLMSGCHKKKVHKKRRETTEVTTENDKKIERPQVIQSELPKIFAHVQDSETQPSFSADLVKIKQEPLDEDEVKKEDASISPVISEKDTSDDLPIALVFDIEKSEVQPFVPAGEKIEKPSCQEIQSESQTVEDTQNNINKKNLDSSKKQMSDKSAKIKSKGKRKGDKVDRCTSITALIKKEPKESKSKKTDKPKKTEPEKANEVTTLIKEELESTDDDEPLIKSKIMKEKEQSDLLKYQLLKDLSEKSAYVKLEFCDVDVNKNSRKSLDEVTREKEERPNKEKYLRQSSRSKTKSLSLDNTKTDENATDCSTDTDEDLCVALRLRLRKKIKVEDNNKVTPGLKTPIKSSSKKLDNSSASSSSTPVRKAGFGDGSDFHPGWEEELYRYKRSIRMPTRLIAIPRGRSGGPFVRGSGALFTRGTTSLPDLDPAPLSPAPSSAPSAATDDLYARRPDKLTLDSDLDSNSSYSATNRLHYDSEASTSTIFSSSKTKKKGSSIVDVLIKKCGKKEDTKKKTKDRDEKTPKIIAKNTSELLPTPSLGLVNNNNRGSLSAKKEKLLENISYLGAFRKETVSTFRQTFLNNTGGLLGATEEFSAVVLKTRTRTESRVHKQRATIREVFGDERPASAPPTSCRDVESSDNKGQPITIKKEPKPEVESKPKLKSKKIAKDKLNRSSSIRDGLRSTKSLKRNDAKGRLMRLKKRNSMMISLNSKRIKEMATNKNKNDNHAPGDDNTKPKDENGSPLPVEGTVEVKRRFKRLFARKKFSSGFDYIRKKKKIIRREDGCPKVRRPIKPSPESVHDIHKEIKGWFINKSVGETHLHRAARLGYTVSCLSNYFFYFV